MHTKVILLVEDDQDDKELALLAFRKSNIANEVVVARDGAEALDYLFGTGAYAGRDAPVLPQVVLLDLKLPKIDGLEVLKRLRDNPHKARCRWSSSPPHGKIKILIESYTLGANSYVRKPVDFAQFAEAVRQLQMYWLVLNGAPSG